MDYRNYDPGTPGSGTVAGRPIVDLSEHGDALLGYEDIAARLTDDQEHRIVDYVKSAHTMAYRQVSKRYEHWDEADKAHDVYVPPDTTDFREKAVISDTRAIADTVLTYLMAALAGRNPMFQLEGMNRKSRKASLINERIIHQQMRRTAGEARLAQMLLDSVRYGMAPTKIVWNANQRTNKWINFDPRRCFHDPRVRWGDWERMQFIVFTDFVAYDTLIDTGQYPKLLEFPGIRFTAPQRAGWEGHRHFRGEGRGHSIDPQVAHHRERSDHAYFTLGDARVIDEAWIRVTGEEVGLRGVQSLYLVITILDEQVVIGMRLNPYGTQWPVVMGGLFNDSHKTYAQSLYDLLLPLHHIGTWLMRSRIDNVQAALNNLMFVDPQRVSIPDLIDRNPWGLVRTLPGTNPGDGVHIAAIPDVTRGHWEDIANLADLKQRVSAASDAQQGIPTTDVRTATEIQRLTQLGSQRLGVLARVLSATAVRPAVRMMVGNIQDALELEGSLRIEEQSAPTALTSSIQEGYLDYEIGDLQGEVDYLVIDGTLPIEPTRNAETWLNILQVMSQTGLQEEYRIDRVAEEAIRSMGVSDLDQFRITPEQREQGLSPSQEMARLEKARGASVAPQGEVEAQVQQGNLVPISQGRKR